jgi:hypothetical protein
MTKPHQPLRLGIDQRLVQRLIRDLGQQASQRLQEEAKRETNLQRAEILQDWSRRLSAIRGQKIWLFRAFHESTS